MKKSFFLIFIILTAFLSYGQNNNKLPYGTVSADEVLRRAFDKTSEYLRVGGLDLSGASFSSDSSAQHWSNLLLGYILSRDTMGNFYRKILFDSLTAQNTRIKTNITQVQGDLDSLLNFQRGSVIKFHNDTTSNGNDSWSLIANFSKCVWITIAADDSIDFSFDATYGTDNVGLLEPNATTSPWAYSQQLCIDPVIYPWIYYRRHVVSGATGTPNVRIYATGR